MSRHQLKTLPSEKHATSVPTLICHNNILIRTGERASAGLDPNPKGRFERYPLQHLCSFLNQNANNAPCMFAGKTNYELERHEWTHLDKRFWEHVCEQCAKRFRQRSHLEQHVISIHERKKHNNVCKCGHAASDSSQIIRHIQAAQQKDGVSAHGWRKYKGKEGARPKNSPRTCRKKPETDAGTSGLADQRPLPQFRPESLSMPQPTAGTDFDNVSPNITGFAQSDNILAYNGSAEMAAYGQIGLGYDAGFNHTLAPPLGGQRGTNFPDFLGEFESELENVDPGVAYNTYPTQPLQNAEEYPRQLDFNEPW